MKATRHVYRFLLALFVALSLTPITAFAEVASQQNDAEIDIPIITVDNAMEAQSILESQSTASEISAQAVAIHVNPVVIRSGFSTHCELYLRWSSADLIDSFRAKNIRISAQGLLNPTEYASWGDGVSYRYYGFTAANAGSKFVGGFSIPTDVSTVRFTAVDFQAFDMRLATWVSSSISTPVAVN